jgi:hypothetical protein
VKKIVLLISGFFYLIAATGTTLHFHYCMGVEAGWSLLKDEKKECGKCGMEKKQATDTGCCKDEVKQAQLEVDQSLTTTTTWEFSSPVIQIHQPLFELKQRNGDPIHKILKEDPPLRSTPVYLFDRNFRI